MNARYSTSRELNGGRAEVSKVPSFAVTLTLLPRPITWYLSNSSDPVQKYISELIMIFRPEPSRQAPSSALPGASQLSRRLGVRALEA